MRKLTQSILGTTDNERLWSLLHEAVELHALADKFHKMGFEEKALELYAKANHLLEEYESLKNSKE